MPCFVCPRVVILAIGLLFGSAMGLTPLLAQPPLAPLGGSPGTDASVNDTGRADVDGIDAIATEAPGGGDAESGIETAGDRLPGVTPVTPAEYSAEERELVDAFQESRQRLADALTEWRATQVRYRNGIDRSAAAVRQFREQRVEVRRRLDETFATAMRVVRRVPDMDAGSYLLTIVQNHHENDVYDELTFEAAMGLLESGVPYAFVFQAAARAAICVGKFDVARQLYEVLEEQNMDDCDHVFRFEMDTLERQYREEMTLREKHADKELPLVRLRTTQGDVLIELFLHEAPSTVAHFIALVEEGFYDELDFYQVKERMFALTGDPAGNGTGHAGRFVVDEHDRPDAHRALRGSLTLAKNRRADGEPIPDSGSSQFAISFLPLPGLLDSGTTFGRVIEGLEHICYARRIDPFEKKEEGQIVLPPDRILSAEVVRKPDDLPEPIYSERRAGLP